LKPFFSQNELPFSFCQVHLLVCLDDYFLVIVMMIMMSIVILMSSYDESEEKVKGSRGSHYIKLGITGLI